MRGGNEYVEKYFKEHPDEYQQFLKRSAEFLSAAQRKFIENNPERFKEIQMMGTKQTMENAKKRRQRLQELVEEYFGE